MSDANESPLERRNFLKTALTGAASLIAPVGAAEAAQAGGAQTAAQSAPQQPARTVPVAAPAPETDPPAEPVGLTVERTGSDFMTDVLKSLPFDYIFANPGDKFRGLQESLTGPYGGNSPEWITCLHEESSVGMAHGYAKMEGKPICVFAHGTVGLQHAAMAIYNAYCDRVPVYIVLGNSLDLEDNHTVQDAAAMVRDFIRWDDAPISLRRFAESAVRAYKAAMTPPRMPVLIIADSELQEEPLARGHEPAIPKLSLVQPPQGDIGSVREAARLLVAAEHPVIVVDKYSQTQAGVDSLVRLAERLQAPVLDQGGRMNFPNRHPLNHSFVRPNPVAEADVVLGLEVSSLYPILQANKRKPSARTISICSDPLLTKGNYQDTGRFFSVDLDIAADAETTLPLLVEEVEKLITPDRRSAFEARGAKLGTMSLQAFEQARRDMGYGWDATPISTGRMNAEVWEAIKNEDWSMVSYVRHFSWWPNRTWPMEKRYQFNGGTGGNGMGYNAPAAVGAAFANKKHGRFTVNFQGDGDLMYAPGVLWTAAHHKIPLLTVMRNNRAYHQELMHIQRMANRHNRGVDNVGIGCRIDDPNIDYAKLAQSMGVYGEGPITNPKDLGPALRRAVAAVKRGEPALVDVVCSAR